MFRRFALFLALAATVTNTTLAAEPLLFDKIIVFGDSLSDDGNLFALTDGQLLPFPYSNGRASNGDVWVEYLADDLGIPMTNMAVVGALEGEGKNDPPPSIIDLGIDPEDLQIPAVGKQIVDYLVFDEPTDESLVVIWTGANRIFFGGGDTELAVENIARHVRKLERNGAKTFLIPNLPPLERTPFGELFADPETKAVLEFLTIDFNIRLALQLYELEEELEVEIIQFDVYSLLNDVIDNPAEYGFVDVTTPSIVFEPGPIAGFLFYDDVHPTKEGHEVLATEAELAIWAELLAVSP